jgi:type II secretory pathway pseudopilin PulG
LMSGNVTGVAAAVAVPSFLKARQTAQRNACINNLRQIDGAKEQWALETNADSNSTPSAEDLDDYLRDGFHGLVCPAGGTYTINPLGEDPECSLKSEGHTLR